MTKDEEIKPKNEATLYLSGYIFSLKEPEEKRIILEQMIPEEALKQFLSKILDEPADKIKLSIEDWPDDFGDVKI